MPYDRWGITNASAASLTGVAEASLTDPVLEAAEAEIVDAIGWDPDHTAYTPADDVRARGFGRAVAWQAAYRTTVARAATDGGGGVVTSESIPGDYSVSYAGGVPVDPILAPRARQILRSHGWLRNVGATTGGGRGGRLAADDWQRNRI